MDQSGGMTAAEVVNQWTQEELRRILYQYERSSMPPDRRRYRPASAGRAHPDHHGAGADRREAMPARALKEAAPGQAVFPGHPHRGQRRARLGGPDAPGGCAPAESGGRLAVITFHSLEDRIVKTGLAEFARGCTCPPDFPVCVCGKNPRSGW